MNEHSLMLWKEGPRVGRMVEILNAEERLVARVWVGDYMHPDYQEGLDSLLLILNAPQLLAVARILADWHCPYGYSAEYGACWECPSGRYCPLVAMRGLLEKIDGEEKTSMAKLEADARAFYIGEDIEPDAAKKQGG